MEYVALLVGVDDCYQIDELAIARDLVGDRVRDGCGRRLDRSRSGFGAGR